MTDLEMAAKFREAAAVICRNGWAQGWGREYDTWRPVCVQQAIMVVTGFTRNGRGPEILIGDQGMANRLMCAAAERVPDGFLSGHPILSIWNDKPERTKGDVISLFEGLAHDLELRHQIASRSPVELASPTLLKEAVPVG